MNGLATVIACYGLFSNSPAVVIGAMIIAMLLGPISGVALGLVDNDNPLLWTAFGTLGVGIGVVYATAFALGVVHSEIPLTGEIYARTAPNLMDLLIALAGGAAGAVATISPRISVAVVGVAIATALVPPLSASAICLARGDVGLAVGACELALTNIVAIQLASSAVLWIGGFRGNPRATRVTDVLRRNLLSALVVVALALVLGVQLGRVVGVQRYEVAVRSALNAATTNHKGSYLTDMRIQHVGGRVLVVAVYRTPTPFTPEEIRVIEPGIPVMPGANGLDLRIRSVPVTVASRTGYIYSSDPADHDGPR
jgi:uncharacterized hydrophobic protein (TIGR00271 family)